MIRPKNRLAGDTLIEVMISVALVGAVIAGAYAISTRSLREGISAAEHGEAIKLVQNQIELLKFRERISSADMWKTVFATAGSPPTGHSNFCLKSDISGPTNPDGTQNPDWLPQDNVNPAILTVSASTYNAACAADNQKYFVNISEHDVNGPASGFYPTYLVTVQWVPEGGGPPSQSEAYYRF